MNAPIPSHRELDALRSAAARLQTNAANLEALRAQIDAQARRNIAVLVWARLLRIMQRVREQP